MAKSSLDKLGNKLAEFSSQEAKEAKRLEAAAKKLEEEQRKFKESRKQRAKDQREVWAFLEEGGAEFWKSALLSLKQNESSILFVKDLLEALLKEGRGREALMSLADLVEMDVPDGLWKKSRQRKEPVQEEVSLLGDAAPEAEVSVVQSPESVA